MEHLFSRLFVPKTIRSHGGTFVLGNEWSMDHSFTGPFVPGNFSSREWMNPGPFNPRTIRSLEHLFLIIKSCGTSFSAVPSLAVPKSPSIMGTVISTSAGFSTSGMTSISGQESTSGTTSISGQESTSGIAAELPSPRTRDLRTTCRSFVCDWRRQNAALQVSERAFGPPDEIQLAT